MSIEIVDLRKKKSNINNSSARKMYVLAPKGLKDSIDVEKVSTTSRGTALLLFDTRDRARWALKNRKVSNANNLRPYQVWVHLA